MLQGLASWCYQHRRRVVALWVVALVVFLFGSSAIGSAFSESFELPGSESQRASDLLEERFPEFAGGQGEIVFEAEAGVDDPAVRARMESLFDEIAELPDVVRIESPYAPDGAHQIAPGGDVAYAGLRFDGDPFESMHGATSDVPPLVEDARTAGLQIEMGGFMFQEGGEPGGTAELVGLAAAVVILLVTFGSVIAMGLPILMALFGIGLGVSTVAVLSQVVAIPDFATTLAMMIGIGVGIDYALFIVTRYRTGLHDGLTPQRAVTLAIDTAGRAVVFAGITVVVSILGLLFMGIEFVRGLALGVAATVLFVMLTSITLLPAVLGFVGHKIDRFGLPKLLRSETRSRQSFWFRWSRLVQRRPWTAGIAGLVILVVLAIPMVSMRLAFEDAGSNPSSDTTRRAYDLVAEGFGAGVNGPLLLAVEYPPGEIASLDPLLAALGETPGVDAVSPPRPNAADDTAVIQVTPSTSPRSEETTQLVHHLRDDVVPGAIEGTDAQVDVGGFTASGVDVSDLLSSRLPFLIGGVLLLSFLLLLVVFRSILVPVKAVVVNLLGIGAAYGLVVAVFQWGWLQSVFGLDTSVPIAPFIPMMMFAIVFGLSMDYEVFLLSRIREEYDRTGDNALAVADGLATTARVITAAALIMVVVFGSFVFGDYTVIKIFGLGLAGAIFIDATVVRMVLVPATMELLGDANWWFPRWLDRVVPRLNVEASPDVVAQLEGDVPPPSAPEPVGVGD